MSRETTEARAAARDAESTWTEHRRLCSLCTAAARARQWDKLCDAGAAARDAWRAAQAAVRESRLLDAEPIAGQLELL